MHAQMPEPIPTPTPVPIWEPPPNDAPDYDEDVPPLEDPPGSDPIPTPPPMQMTGRHSRTQMVAGHSRTQMAGRA